jgi:hypothetical protein
MNVGLVSKTVRIFPIILFAIWVLAGCLCRKIMEARPGCAQDLWRAYDFHCVVVAE